VFERILYQLISVEDSRLSFVNFIFRVLHFLKKAPIAQSVLATGDGLEGPEIEFHVGVRFSRPSRPALGPTQPLIQ